MTTMSKLSLFEFDTRAKGITLKPAIREAAWRVLVGGETWAASAKAMGVPESSIKRAIDRITAPRCKCCGGRINAKNPAG